MAVVKSLNTDYTITNKITPSANITLSTNTVHIHLTPKGYHPAHTFKDGCTGCAICAVICPDAAITVYREVTKAATVAV